MISEKLGDQSSYIAFFDPAARQRAIGPPHRAVLNGVERMCQSRQTAPGRQTWATLAAPGEPATKAAEPHTAPSGGGDQIAIARLLAGTREPSAASGSLVMFARMC